MGAIVGVDIGSEAIKAVFAEEVDGKKIKVLAVASKKVTDDNVIGNGSIEQITTVAKLVGEVLDVLLKNVANVLNDGLKKPHIDSININISGEHLKQVQKKHVNHLNAGTITAQTDIDYLYSEFCRINHSPINGTDILHVLPLKFMADMRELNVEPIGRDCNSITLDANLLTVKSNYLKTLHTTVAHVKVKDHDGNPLKIDKIVLSGLAAATATLTDSQKKDGVILIDIGREVTSILIFKNGNLKFQKQLFIGGKSISVDLRNAFKIKEDFAEKIKQEIITLEIKTVNPHEIITIGKDEKTLKKIPKINACLVAEARLIELFAMVNAEIKLSGIDKEDLHDGIVLTGGTANLDGLSALVSELIGLETNLGELDNFMETEIDEATKLDYATAIGLALWDVRTCDVYESEKHAVPMPPPVTVNITKPPVAELKGEDSSKKGNIFTNIFGKFGASEVRGDEL